MSNPKRTAVEQLDALIDAYLEDLLELPDEAILPAPEHSEMQRSAFSEMKKAAYVEAGKRRLARAKRAVVANTLDTGSRQPIDLVEARRYLAQAANDARITLAARDMRDMPDEEVERLYLQLRELESAQSAKRD